MLKSRSDSGSREICVPYFNGQQGVPAIFTRRFYGNYDLRGDVGARRIVRRNARPDGEARG